MTKSIWQLSNQINKNKKNDIIIIGAGFVGLSVAYWLTEFRPDLNILILEKEEPGYGASGRNAGFLTKGSLLFYHHLFSKFGRNSALEIYNYVSQSIELVEQHIFKNSKDIFFEKTNSLTLLSDRRVPDGWVKEQFSPHDFNFVQEESLDFFVKKSWVRKIFRNDYEYKINPIKLLTFLQDTLAKRNVRLRKYSQVFNVENKRIHTDSEVFESDKVIISLNGYSSQLNPSLRALIRPVRAQMLAVQLKKSFVMNSLVYHPEERVYFRTEGARLLLIGGKRTIDTTNEETDIDQLNVKIQQELQDYIAQNLGLEFQIKRRWSGIMGFTENELPIVSHFENKNDLFLIGGFSGHGMGMGFKSAKELVELVTNVKKKSLFQSIQSQELNWKDY